MSLLDTRLGQTLRKSPLGRSHAGSSPAGERSLADLRRGQSAQVTSIREAGNPDWARRLMHLGFAPGSLVEVVRPTPLGDPTVFRVCDYEIALRRDLSRMVLIAPLP